MASSCDTSLLHVVEEPLRSRPDRSGGILERLSKPFGLGFTTMAVMSQALTHQTSISPDPAGATLTLFELTMGATMTQAIAVACRLEIPDHLDGRPRSAEDLAKVTGRPPQMVDRLLHLLDSLGIVSGHQGLYTLTEFGSPLRRSASPSLRGWALLAGAPWFWAPLAQLEESLASGRSGFDLVHGREIFDLLSGKAFPGAREIYDEAMGGAVTADAVELCGLVDLADRHHVVDVGGGNGSLCLEVLAANPHLDGTVFDRPSVVQRGSGRSHEASCRCRWEGGDFFEAVPTDGDVYLLSRVLHDWDDRRAGRILRRIHAAMATDQRLLVIEQLLGEDGRPFTPLCDLNMAALYGSGERSRNAMTRLLGAAGFTTVAATQLSSGRFLIEARPDPQNPKGTTREEIR
jgi:hypothetical protein